MKESGLNPDSRVARIEYRWQVLKDRIKEVFVPLAGYSMIDQHAVDEHSQELQEDRLNRLLRRDQSNFAQDEVNKYLSAMMSRLPSRDPLERASRITSSIDQFRSGSLEGSQLQTSILENTDVRRAIAETLKQFDKEYNNYKELLGTTDGVSDTIQFSNYVRTIADFLGRLNELDPNEYQMDRVQKWSQLYIRLICQSIDNFLIGITELSAIQERVFRTLFVSGPVRYGLANCLYYLNVTADIEKISEADSITEVRDKAKQYLVKIDTVETTESE